MNTLTFNDTSFDIVDLNGQPWLRVRQIGGALGYAQPDKQIDRLFHRHRAEFTPSETVLIDVQTPGGTQQVRIFSLRGARRLAMHARTPRAAEFRSWVLDLIEGTATARVHQIDTPLVTPSVETERAAAVEALLLMRPRLRRIAELRALGLSRREIAGAVGVATSTLQADLSLLARIGVVPVASRSTALARIA